MALVRIALFYVLRIAEYLVLARCLISWFPMFHNKFTEFIEMLTEPLMGPVRALISKSFGGSMMGVDFSPIIVFLILSFLQRMVLMF